MERTNRLYPALSTELVLSAYRQGFFPMAHGRHGTIEFYFYEPRGILPLDDRFIVRRSLRQIITKGTFEIHFDTAFREVISSCARYEHPASYVERAGMKPIEDKEIWISEEMIEIYCELHKKGIAHSVEVRKEGNLVGGLYGLTLGSVFCGESMFSRAPFASQVALVALVERLRKNNFTLVDAQMESEHLHQFGLYTVSQKEYLLLLQQALKRECEW